MKQIIKNNFNFLETFIFEGNTSAVSISDNEETSSRESKNCSFER